jgi:hypothetical protein
VVDEPTGYHRGRLRWFDGVPPVDHIHARPEPLRVGNEGRAHIILIVQSAGHASVEQAQLPIECRLAVLGYDGLQVLNGGPGVGELPGGTQRPRAGSRRRQARGKQVKRFARTLAEASRLRRRIPAERTIPLRPELAYRPARRGANAGFQR